MANKEQFEKEIHLAAARKGFKLVDPHQQTPLVVKPEAPVRKEEELSCPIRFTGKGFLGKKITVYVPKKYCTNGTINSQARERLAREGYCGFAERSKEIYDCELVFKANSKEQWLIEIAD
jgi:hypothetical protein